MNPARLRRLLLRLFIIFLCISAALAVFAVLGGGFGDLQLRIILSTLAVAGANICGMPCAACLHSRGKNPGALAGMVCSGVAALLVLGGIWLPTSDDDYWKITFSLVIVSVAFAHACGLMIPRPAPQHQWTQKGAVTGSAILALMVLAALWGQIESSDYYRLMAVVVILLVLFTFLVPLLPQTNAAPAPHHTRLILDPVSPGLYRDASGTLYRVEPQGIPGPEQEKTSASSA